MHCTLRIYAKIMINLADNTIDKNYTCSIFVHVWQPEV